MNRIVGRARNMLHMPDGSTRWPTFLLATKRRELPPAQIQIVQTELDALELRAVLEPGHTADDEARLYEYLRAWAGPEFRLSVKIVDEIPRGPGGKFEEFLSELPQ